MDLELEIQNSKDVYLNFFKYYYLKKTIIIKIYYSVFLGVFTFASNSMGLENYSNSIRFLFSSIVAIIFFLILTFTPYLIALRFFLKSLASEKSPIGTKKIIINESGFQVDSNRENVFWNWNSVSYTGNTEKFIFIVLLTKQLYILPSESFSSVKEYNSLAGFIQNKILSKYGINRRRIDVKDLYLWGIIGLLPPIGIFSGVYFIYRGIFEYKDKYLIIIGLANILYTVGYFYFIH